MPQKRYIVYPQGGGIAPPPPYNAATDVTRLRRPRVVFPESQIVSRSTGLITLNAGVIPNAQTLLAYLKSLGFNSGGVISGQTDNVYSGASNNPMSVFFSGGNVGPWTVATNNSGGFTTLCPGILNMFARGPGNGGSPSDSTYTGAAAFGARAQAWMALNGIVHVSMSQYNPAWPQAAVGYTPSSDSWLANPELAYGSDTGFGNGGSISSYEPWNNTGNGILVNGSAIQNAWYADLDNVSVMLNQIPGPFILNPWGEIGNFGAYSRQTGSGASWFNNPQTLGQYITAWQLMYTRMMNWNGGALANKILWSFNVGADSWAGGHQSDVSMIWPGTSFVDIIAMDQIQPADSDTVIMANELGSLSGGMPLYMASTGYSTSGATPFSVDNWTQVIQTFCTGSNAIPQFFGYAMFCQSLGLGQQNGAVNCMSNSNNMLNISNLPVGGFARNK